MASVDEAAMAALAEDALDKQTRYNSLWQATEEATQRPNRNSGEVMGEFVAAAAAEAAMSSSRAGGHPTEIEELMEIDPIARQSFRQEAVKVIDSLIALDMQENPGDSELATFMQTLQREAVGDAANSLFETFYQHCAIEVSSSEYEFTHIESLEQCIFNKLQYMLGMDGEQRLVAGATVSQIEMAFEELEHQIQTRLEALKEGV